MGLGEILDAIASWAQSIIRSGGYPGLILVMFLENVFPPIPSEAILPMAGWLALDGHFTLLGVTAGGITGSVAGAFVFYVLGKLLGEERVRQLLRDYGKWLMLTEEDFDKALAWFNRYGEGVIFFGRMVPVVRSLVSVPAGIADMNLGRFAIYTAIGTGLWSFLLAIAGYLLGQSWPLVYEWISRYEKIVLIFGALAVIVFVVHRWQKRKKNAASLSDSPDRA